MADEERKEEQQGEEQLNFEERFRRGMDISGYFSTGQKVFLGLQHTLAMFGATILIPIITGLSVSATLFAAGVGTIIFHFMTGHKVPAFLGSSFAFVAPILVGADVLGLQYVQAGIIGAGVVYLIVGLIVRGLGPDRVARVFPPVVTGPIIMTIGLGLAPIGIDMASEHYGAAAVALVVALVVSLFGKGMLKVIPVIFGLLAGYIVAAIIGLVDFSPVAEAGWIGLPGFTAPKFDWAVLAIVTPAALVSLLEHIGDVLAIGNTVGRDVKRDPGLDPTLYGGGIATIISGAVGGASLTTYGENIGVLALTRIYSTFVVTMGALWAILLSIVPKIEALIMSIPEPVIGGVSVLLYGMIAAVGVRTVVENQVNLVQTRNLIIASVILVLGVGDASFEIGETVEVSSMVVAAVAGIVLNLILPVYEEEEAPQE